MPRDRHNPSRGGGEPTGAPTGISEILSSLRQTTNLGVELDRAQIWEKWPDIVGPALASHGQPIKFKRKKLYVQADSAVWMHKYAYLKFHIINHINELAGYELVSDLHIGLLPEDEAGEAQDAGF